MRRKMQLVYKQCMETDVVPPLFFGLDTTLTIKLLREVYPCLRAHPHCYHYVQPRHRKDVLFTEEA